MAGSSNFLVHNPNCNNQENDAAYEGDSLRTGGINFGNPLPSLWLNKVWYQASIFAAAFCQMMANKGYSPNDGSASPSTALNNLATVLANVLTKSDPIFAPVAGGASSTFTFVNPSGPQYNATFSVPAQILSDYPILRITAGFVCTVAPTNPAYPVIAVNTGLIGGLGYAPMTKIGDYVRIVAEVNCAEVTVYCAGQGVLGGVAANPSQLIRRSSAFGDLSEPFEVQAGIYGQGSGQFVNDYLVVEPLTIV